MVQGCIHTTSLTPFYTASDSTVMVEWSDSSYFITSSFYNEMQQVVGVKKLQDGKILADAAHGDWALTPAVMKSIDAVQWRQLLCLFCTCN